MSVNVDPFVIPIPQKLLNDPELGPTFQYLWKFLYDLWSRTGGGTDYVSDLTDDFAALDTRVDVAENDIDALESLTANSIVTTAVNYTITTSGQVVRVTAAATVSLPAAPSDQYRCAVESQTTGAVTVSGNGKTIQGDSTDTIYVADTLIEYQFFTAIDAWVRR